ncbi:hypothetical protein EIN_052980 [Entamoeba invadens IP1]|uniref:hypothetical protein n=1 Tax=Entamoeba invadens IP1 TaxID=370355 RepID=UPI0002C3D07E|nr:hypothetical protein EIN_052980 [Entamoeba invadens IP1]ELP93073.1 hypothetical protein EIN_052980 [Entamoeba invadens IP1]|eukprot:XP_004259844.1 hypothetical protein EIN_052980 [Entamoeba invadens IP1]
MKILFDLFPSPNDLKTPKLYPEKVSLCPVCNKKAYPMEAISIEGVTMHKTCFKCSVCKKVLSGSNFAKNHGVFYCKVHFAQMFKEKGNYDEGFGCKKASANWEEHHGEEPKKVEKKEELKVEPKKEEPKVEKKEEQKVEPKVEVKEKIVEKVVEKVVEKIVEKEVPAQLSKETFDQVNAILKQVEKIEGQVGTLEKTGITAPQTSGSLNNEFNGVFDRLNAALDKLEKK